MLRRKFLSSILAAMLLITTFGAATCDKQTALSNADDILFSVKEAQPLIAQLLPSAGPKIEQAVKIAQKLRDAVAASQSTTAIGYLSDLIVVTQEIVRDDVSLITDPNTRTIIMTSLALANIGMHYLSRHLVQTPAALGTRSKANPIVDFDAEPVWGTSYKYNKRK